MEITARQFNVLLLKSVSKLIKQIICWHLNISKPVLPGYMLIHRLIPRRMSGRSSKFPRCWLQFKSGFEFLCRSTNAFEFETSYFKSKSKKMSRLEILHPTITPDVTLSPKWQQNFKNFVESQIDMNYRRMAWCTSKLLWATCTIVPVEYSHESINSKPHDKSFAI